MPSPFGPMDVAPIVGLAVAKIVLCIVGSAYIYRSLRRAGKVDQSLISMINLVNVKLFIPIFIFSKCSQGLTLELVSQLTFVPVLVAAFLAIGLACGTAAAKLTCAPRGMCVAVAQVTVCFSNVIGLPLPLLISLAHSIPTVEDPATASARATSCGHSGHSSGHSGSALGEAGLTPAAALASPRAGTSSSATSSAP